MKSLHRIPKGKYPSEADIQISVASYLSKAKLEKYLMDIFSNKPTK